MKEKFQKGYCPIFDIHVHMMGQKLHDDQFLEFAKDWNMPFCISSLGPYGEYLINSNPDEFRKSNDMVLELAEKNPDLVYGFCYVNPVYVEESVAEIERCICSYGMYGVKIWVGCRCNDERTFPVVEKAIELDVPILVHSFLRLTDNLTGESYPSDVAFLADKYPKAKILMAHMGFNWRRGVDEIKDCPNVMVDSSGLDPEYGMLEYAVEMLGVDRVFYGSDAPGRDVLCQIGKVVAADISDADMRKILNENAQRLLGTKRNRSMS